MSFGDSTVDERTPDEQLRVLLLVAHRRDRELFADRLGDRYTVTTAEPGDEWPDFDLCLVDSDWYRSVADALHEQRAAAEPVQLPVLLLLRGRPTDNPWLGDALGGVVDDVVELPTNGMELDARVDSLARARRMSMGLAAQRDQLRLFRRAIEEAAVGITIADYTKSDNPLIYGNDRFTEITGYDSGEYLGRNCRFLQGPDTDPEPVAELRRTIDAGEATRVQLWNYRKDSTPFRNRVSVAPVRDEAGTITHYVGFQEDVTEERSRERQVETLLQTAADPIFEVDTGGRFTLVNDEMVAALGYDRETLLGADASLIVPEERVAEATAMVQELAESDRDRATLETTVTAADGERRIYQINLSIREDGADFQGVVGICRDVTALRRNERRLSVFDRVLRHNLRNKMNIVLARAESIIDGADDPVAQAEAIRRASEELLALSERTREFHASIDPDGEPERVNVTDLVRRVAADGRETFVDASIVVDAPDAAWGLAHEALEQALDELVTNAVTHSDREAPTVELGVDVDEDRAVVRVADDGPGIGDLEQEALERGHETPLGHASGLGLWFVRWTVTNAGGDIAIETNEPRGSVVRLSLPQAEPPDTADR